MIGDSPVTRRLYEYIRLYNCRPLEVMYSQDQKDSKESAAKRCTTLLKKCLFFLPTSLLPSYIFSTLIRER